MRTDVDLPIWVTPVGAIVLALVLTLLPQLAVNLLGAVLIVLFGFFFVVVSSRITGEIGVSANPISGMTIATLIGTTSIFLLIGWTGVDHRVGRHQHRRRHRGRRGQRRHHQPGPQDRLPGRRHAHGGSRSASSSAR